MKNRRRLLECIFAQLETLCGRLQAVVTTLRAYNLFQGDDIFVVKPLQQLDLSDGCDGEAFLLVVHPDLLQCHTFMAVQVLA